MDFQLAKAQALDAAEKAAEGQVLDALEENLPEDAEQSEWNWEALAKTVNTRWQLSVRDRDLKRINREELAEHLITRAKEAAAKVDLSEGERFLRPDFGVQTACNWAKYKFGVTLNPAEMDQLDLAALKDLVRGKAAEVYGQKECEYPVIAGLYHFTTRDPGGHKRYDREGLVAWAAQRFQVQLDLEDLKNKQRDEIRALLVDRSRQHAAEAQPLMAEAGERLEAIFALDPHAPQAIRAAHEKGVLQSLAQWLREKTGAGPSADDMLRLERKALERAVMTTIDDHFRPEMRKMERALLLELLDMAWKDHLLAMDHLKSSIGLRGYAQVDPKVEYKREGMKTFEQMWTSVGERVTDLVFRMEQLDEGFVGSTWSGAQARHDQAPSTSEISQQQQDAIDGTQADRKPEPIRKHQQQVGRNDPCPCKSGKKFKNCCMRKGG